MVPTNSESTKSHLGYPTEWVNYNATSSKASLMVWNGWCWYLSKSEPALSINNALRLWTSPTTNYNASLTTIVTTQYWLTMINQHEALNKPWFIIINLLNPYELVTIMNTICHSLLVHPNDRLFFSLPTMKDQRFSLLTIDHTINLINSLWTMLVHWLSGIEYIYIYKALPSK